MKAVSPLKHSSRKFFVAAMPQKYRAADISAYALTMFYVAKAPLRGAMTMKQTLQHLNHSVGQNSFHLVWKPKWAKDPFKFELVHNVCVASLRKACHRHGLKLIELEVMPDHVHCFVELHPSMSVSKAFQVLKGYSSRMLFKHHPWLRRHFRTGHLWSPGKFFRSVRAVTEEAIKNYIAQSNRGSKYQTQLRA